MTDTDRPTIRLGDLRRATVPVAVAWQGQTITLEYRPYALSGVFDAALLGALEAATTELDVYAAFRAHLPAIVAGWNLTDDADAPLPVTTETLAEVPGATLSAWYAAIREHLRPNPGSAPS